MYEGHISEVEEDQSSIQIKSPTTRANYRQAAGGSRLHEESYKKSIHFAKHNLKFLKGNRSDFNDN